MKQRLKLLTFLACVSATFLFAAHSISKQVVDGIVKELLWKYAQISAHHDAETLLAPIIKEVNLISELAEHPNVTSWGMNSNDDVYRAVAEETLDRFRWQLKSKNFFIVLDENLAYHYNDVQSVREQDFLRYYLDPASAQDNWYFEQRGSGVEFSVNIARDAHLNLTRVWINHSIVDGGRFLGIVGTGIDTNLLFERFDEHHSHALKTLFVDEGRRVQFSVDSHKFHYPLRDSENTKPTLSDYIPNSDEYSAIETLMQRQKSGEEAEILMVQQESGKAVVAIHYIEALGWYELTFVSIDAMVPSWAATSLYLPLTSLVFLCALMSYLYLVKHWILPVERVSKRLGKLTRFKSVSQNLDEAVDLIEHELNSARTGLEELVTSRTEQIDKLAIFDFITGLHNRRGLERELRAELARSSREQHQFGLIWIDAGLSPRSGGVFDSEKHQNALKAVASCLTKAIREYDVAARWDEGEFLLLVRTDSNKILLQIACRIKQYVEQAQASDSNHSVLVNELSVGGTLIKPNVTMQQALALADSSLYIAKSETKDAIYIHEASNVA
ncbi:GGDEF domain-containing protein [Vibrio europaeus]|uniref:GGDEF domain-containing protein n=1 Tax=Vibrio europaeus TaxID=300876 RepID=UPI0039E06FAC